jgi:predicted SAM-dependent methyltransferase
MLLQVKVMETQKKNQVRVNIGCGMTPTPGFENFDNSFSLKLSKYPLLSSLLYKFKIISHSQMDYIQYCQTNDIKWADATREIPLPNNSVSLIYSSHMLEHLDRTEAAQFLKEAMRVLKTGGTIRLVLPDLSKSIELYNIHKDADAFLESTLMCSPNPRSFLQRLKIALIGNRHHLWMYDGKSLAKLLQNNGYKNIKILESGETTIDCGALDLRERADESIYIEAIKI